MLDSLYKVASVFFYSYYRSSLYKGNNEELDFTFIFVFYTCALTINTLNTLALLHLFHYQGLKMRKAVENDSQMINLIAEDEITIKDDGNKGGSLL